MTPYELVMRYMKQSFRLTQLNCQNSAKGQGPKGGGKEARFRGSSHSHRGDLFLALVVQRARSAEGIVAGNEKTVREFEDESWHTSIVMIGEGKTSVAEAEHPPQRPKRTRMTSTRQR